MQLPPTLRPSNFHRSLASNVPAKVGRDAMNRLLYGPDAPLSDECIYVDPQSVRFAYSPQDTQSAPRFRRRHSGLVVDGDWDVSVHPVSSGIKEEACALHYLDGVPWEETGVIDYLMADVARKGSADGLQTREDFRSRYRKLDQMVESIKREGAMKPRRELGSYFRREHGGVFVHISRDGTPLKAGGGTHRLAIAKLLGLKKIPAQLGVIHEQAVRSGLMTQLRRAD